MRRDGADSLGWYADDLIRNYGTCSYFRAYWFVQPCLIPSLLHPFENSIFMPVIMLYSPSAL